MSDPVLRKNWPSASEAAPKKCRCGRKLPSPIYSLLPPEINKDRRHRTEKQWQIRCECGSVLIWSWPNVYKQSHILEIGRTMEIVAGL